MEAVQTRDEKYSIEQSPYSLLICSNRRERERERERERDGRKKKEKKMS